MSDDPQVVVIMGSRSDLPFVEQITAALEQFGLSWEMRIASAHKSARHLLQMLEEYGQAEGPRVYITVAGRSNALAGMVDANVVEPVITCAPYSEKFAGADVLSSLRMPSGVAPAVVLEPEAAALLAAKMLAVHDSALRERVRDYQAALNAQIIADDAEAKD
jgi:5-(carboxyamino)imidazole ribonucleotide mutase/phosphoribosylaminoimidazole-succinocarboxamide synthase